MDSWVINLPQAAGRREDVLRRCTAVGLDPVVVDAIDGDLNTAPTLAGLTRGEVGCLMSHRKVLEQIRDSDTPGYHLVLEEDVVFYEGFIDALGEVLAKAAEEDLGLVQVGWLPTDEQSRLLPRSVERLKAARQVRRIANLFRPSTGVLPPSVVPREIGWGTHCYVVDREYAETVLSFLQDPLLAPVDAYFRALATLQPARVWRTRFPAAGQDWGYGSSVNSGRFEYQRHQFDQRGVLGKALKTGRADG